MCVCVHPAVGSATSRAAYCTTPSTDEPQTDTPPMITVSPVPSTPPPGVLDECDADCDTCASGICKDAGQKCQDVAPSPDSLFDWECVCVPPGVGTSRGTVAHCTTPSTDEPQTDTPPMITVSPVPSTP